MCRVAVETGQPGRASASCSKSSVQPQGDSSHSPKASGWFEGVKRFFGDL
jgi:molecular chaperone DnaJ